MAWLAQKSATPNDAVNLAPATGPEAVFNWKAAMKQMGATVTRSSDGTTYNAAADIITQASTGANGMANNNAWFVLAWPDGRQWLVMRGTSNVNWLVMVSHSAGFTGGSPSATRRSTATDEQFRAGGGTDAVPTFTGVFATDGTYKQHIIYDNAAPYAWHMLLVVTGATGMRVWWHAPMLAGSHNPLDTAPYIDGVMTATPSITTMAGVTMNTSEFGAGYYKKGLSGEAYVQFRGLIYAANITLACPNAEGNDPYDNIDAGDPIRVSRLTADGNGGRKGFLSTQQAALPGSTHSWPDTLDVDDNADAVVDRRYVASTNTGCLLFRWPLGITPNT